ncbi:hypothetical protein DFJ63DRAFT_337120 [Scheffersomyces coipomensis]|uniref:uncharacterized protein n=1 Tax=Scheffersomyces coipomensis TaxID=1788519 RepID=UPI00315D9BAC
MNTEDIQLVKIVRNLEDISIKDPSDEDEDVKFIDQLEVIIPPSSSRSDLSPLDLKTIELLELIEQYEQLINDSYRLNFINGYLNLSRANYNYISRRFSSNSFDYRPYSACKEISIDQDTQEFSIIDNFAVEKAKQNKTKSNKETKETKEKEESSYSSSTTTPKQLTNTTTTTSLKKRKDASTTSKEKSSIITEDPISDTPTKPSLRDPVNQFGSLVPYQLRQSQDYFNKALADSIAVINLRTKIDQLITDIEKLNQEQEDKEVN